MIQEIAISIFSGGAGSGCRGSNCGRPRGKSSLTSSWKIPKGMGALGTRLPNKELSKDVDNGYDWLAVLPMSQVRTSEATVADKKVVAKYAEAMRQGSRFPILQTTLARNGQSVKIFNGNHRFLAWQALGHKSIPVWISG